MKPVSEPQLSAEMEKRFDEEFGDEHEDRVFSPFMITVESQDIKHFLATALEEQRDKMVESVEAYIDAIYPLNRFIDSSTGVVTRGVQEPTHVRMMRVEDAQTFNALEHVLSILTKKEQ